MKTYSHSVYRIYNEAGALLYVGCTYNVPDRVKAHRKTQPWADEIAHVESEGPFPPMEALNVERQAIRRLKPRYNVAHNRAPHLPPLSMLLELPQDVLDDYGITAQPEAQDDDLIANVA